MPEPEAPPERERPEPEKGGGAPKGLPPKEKRADGYIYKKKDNDGNVTSRHKWNAAIQKWREVDENGNLIVEKKR
jgi:hypothetical protein